MSSGNGLLRHPFKNFNDGSITRPHDYRGAVCNQLFSPERRQVVANQFQKSVVAAGLRLVASNRNGAHAV